MAECRKGIPSKYSRVTRSLFLNEGRGLSGVYFVISDDHCGITKAVDKQFQGATWQRCQVHLMCRVTGSGLALTHPSSLSDMMLNHPTFLASRKNLFPIS